MTDIDRSYIQGMKEAFEHGGLEKVAAQCAAEAVVSLKKQADLFNFSDYQDPHAGGVNWSSIIVPILAAAAAGYVGYQSRDKGHSNLSAFDNVKNYVAGIGDKYVRRTRPRPIYDIRRYIDN